MKGCPSITPRTIDECIGKGLDEVVEDLWVGTTAATDVMEG